tara:strand:+ start:1942 stop:2466 length:525 start_codon:yes stop_codon:yes gene_type:complete
MHGISQFYDTFFDKSPFKNVEKPAKPKISDAERTGISDKEHHAISSNTDANSVMIIVDKKGNKVEPNKKPPTKMSPLEAGGYEGGGDVAGATYIPTAHMYTDMFNKIGQAAMDIESNIKGKEKSDEMNKWLANNSDFGPETPEYKNKYTQIYGKPPEDNTKYKKNNDGTYSKII